MTQRDRDRLVILKKAQKKLITQREAAAELGITERQVRRLLHALKRRGDEAVIHALRGLPSKSEGGCGNPTEGSRDSVEAGVPGIWPDAGV